MFRLRGRKIFHRSRWFSRCNTASYYAAAAAFCSRAPAAAAPTSPRPLEPISAVYRRTGCSRRGCRLCSTRCAERAVAARARSDTACRVRPTPTRPRGGFDRARRGFDGDYRRPALAVHRAAGHAERQAGKQTGHEGDVALVFAGLIRCSGLRRSQNSQPSPPCKPTLVGLQPRGLERVVDAYAGGLDVFGRADSAGLRERQRRGDRRALDVE